ncbi:MAG TPA: O-antigen ligase family protein [Mycobacteriales bacterium]|nr:O-antigen ligase family protein [Mycobacteriales bacterium]
MSLVPRLPSAAVGVVGAALVVALLLLGGLKAAAVVIAAGAAVAAILAASRHPAGALGVIIVYPPFQFVTLAWLFKLGAPALVVRDLGYVKDAMVLGIGLAALQHRHARGGPGPGARAFEYAAGVYVAIASVYLLAPFAIPGAFGGQSWSIRINAWRLDCLFILLMLFCTKVPFRRVALPRLALLVLLVGLVEFGSALWEKFDRHSYSNFFVHTIDLAAYERAVLHIDSHLVQRGFLLVSASGSIRAGGFSVSQIELGFLTVLPLAIGMQSLVGSRPNLRKLLWPGAALTTVILTQTRSAILACLIALLVVVYVAFKRRSRVRMLALAMVVLGAVASVPLAGHSSFVQRFASIFNSSSTEDNQTHSKLSRQGWTEVLSQPVGLGLGANPATGHRFHTSNSTTTENSYLQVGTELGLGGMGLFIFMYLSVLRELWRRRWAAGAEGDLAVALFAAGCGFAVGGLFLQIWNNFPVSLPFWGLIGVMLGASSHRKPSSRYHPISPGTHSTEIQVDRTTLPILIES